MFTIQKQITLKELITMNTQSNSITDKRGKSAVFSAPLDGLKKGQLEIANGISNFELTGDPSVQNLFHAQFSGVIPAVRTSRERVLIRYHRSTVGWFLHELMGGRQDGRVGLNTSIPWQIELRGGVSNLDADLRDLQLSSLVITGGVSDADILLPPPMGTIQIHIASGVSNLRIFHPQAVPARLRVGGGISRLVFDDQLYPSVGGGIQLETPEYKAESNRYEIVVSSGVSNLVVRTQA
jgi:hypothetical protein